MEIGESICTTCIFRMVEFTQIDKKGEKKIDAILDKYNMTYYPSTSEVIAPIDTKLEYGDAERIIEEIKEAVAKED
jgi:hypothetical protein